MTRLYAQPYDIAATGFYFDSVVDFERLARANENEYGQPVEEYEIQFIDGERIDAEFAQALGLNQVNFFKFLDLVDEWEYHQKIRFIIANGECGYDFDIVGGDIDALEIDIYEVRDLKELAAQFVDEGLFGDVPKAFENYIDHEAIARDLSIDYATTEIAGEHFTYRCG